MRVWGRGCAIVERGEKPLAFLTFASGFSLSFGGNPVSRVFGIRLGPFFVLDDWRRGFPGGIGEPFAHFVCGFCLSVSLLPCISVVCQKYTTPEMRLQSEYGGRKQGADGWECRKIAKQEPRAPEIERKMDTTGKDKPEMP